MVLSNERLVCTTSSLCASATSGVDLTATIERLLQNRDWAPCLQAVASIHCLQSSHQKQHQALCTDLTPATSSYLLHKACQSPGIPGVLLQTFIQTWPQACLSTCRQTQMTPLHLLIESVHSNTSERTSSSNGSNSNSAHIILSYLHALMALSTSHQHTNMIQTALETPARLTGELPLHTACRVGAPLSVIAVLVQIYPQAVHAKCQRNCTPLDLLWRPYRNRTPETSSCQKDLPQCMMQQQIWEKTLILLQQMARGADSIKNEKELSGLQLHSSANPHSLHTFHPLHAAASTHDCPRIVLQWAAHLYSVASLDERKRTPLHYAAKSQSDATFQQPHSAKAAESTSKQEGQSPSHDPKQDVSHSKWEINDDGEFDYEQLEQDMENEQSNQEHQALYSYFVGEDESADSIDDSSSLYRLDPTCREEEQVQLSPIECLLQAEKNKQSRADFGDVNATSWKDADGRLPLHWACEIDKDWKQDGLHALVKAYPDGLQERDPITGLWPFQLAAAQSNTPSPLAQSNRKPSKQSHANDDETDKVSTIYELLRADPAALETAQSALPQVKRNLKRNQNTCLASSSPDTTTTQFKRRKRRASPIRQNP